MIKIDRRIQFCAGHRVLGHEGKCANIHGHNYVAHVWAEAPGLDSVGRIVDFSVLKDHFGEWIERNWDHGFIANHEDAEVRDFMLAHQFKMFTLPYNPTAENLAKYIVEVVGKTLDHSYGVRVVECVIQETENCSASYRV